MTTLCGTTKNLTSVAGFFVLVAAAIAVSTLVRGSTVVGIVFVLVALALVAAAVVLARRPGLELRVSGDVIELGRGARSIRSLTRADTGGSVEVRRHIYRGQAFWSLVAAGGAPESGLEIDDFVPDEVRAAVAQHGWTVSVVE